MAGYLPSDLPESPYPGLAFDSHGKLYVLENTTGGNEYPTPGRAKSCDLAPNGIQPKLLPVLIYIPR